MNNGTDPRHEAHRRDFEQSRNAEEPKGVAFDFCNGDPTGGSGYSFILTFGNVLAARAPTVHIIRALEAYCAPFEGVAFAYGDNVTATFHVASGARLDRGVQQFICKAATYPREPGFEYVEDVLPDFVLVQMESVEDVARFSEVDAEVVATLRAREPHYWPTSCMPCEVPRRGRSLRIRCADVLRRLRSGALRDAAWALLRR